MFELSRWTEGGRKREKEVKQLLYFHSYLLRDGCLCCLCLCPWPLLLCLVQPALPPCLPPYYFTCQAHAFISRHLTKAKSSHIVYLEADGHLYEINLYTHTHTDRQACTDMNICMCFCSTYFISIHFTYLKININKFLRENNKCICTQQV